MPIMVLVAASVGASAVALPPTDYQRPLDMKDLQVAVPVAPAIRANLMPEPADMPATPRTFTFLCTLENSTGELLICVSADTGNALPRNAAEHAQSFTNEMVQRGMPGKVETADDRLRMLAKQRIGFYRFKPLEPPATSVRKQYWPVLVRETIASDDVHTVDVTKPLVPVEQLSVSYAPAARPFLGSYYPHYALVNAISIKLVARCEVTPELSLYCWSVRLADGESTKSHSMVERSRFPAPPVMSTAQVGAKTKGGQSAASHSMVERFRLPALQILSTAQVGAKTKDGQSAVGLQVELPINFTVSEDRKVSFPAAD